MLPRKKIENLHAVLTILVRFESRNFYLNFLTLIQSASRNMIHFVRTFSTICVLKTEDLSLSKRFQIINKLYTSKTFLKMAGGRMDTPHPTSWIRPWP